MAFKIVELRPNRNLLDSNFNGYKLSLDPTPLLITELESTPLQCQQRDDQYSFLHAHIFGLENHLERDLWNPGSGYFVTSDWNVKKIDRNPETGRMNPIINVFKVPRYRDVIKGDYNPNIKFISDNMCLLSDGIGTINLIETHTRNENKSWDLIKSFKPLDEKYFILKDARFDIDDSKQLNILLLHVVQEETTFFSTLEWINYSLQENSVEQITHRTLQGKGVLYYACLDEKCDGVIISSDKPIEFIYDSENLIVISNGDVAKESNLEIKNDIYSWSQTIDEVFIHFHHKNESESFDYNIFCENNKLSVKIKDKTIVVLELCSNIVSDSIGKAWEVSKEYNYQDMINKPFNIYSLITIHQYFLRKDSFIFD